MNNSVDCFNYLISLYDFHNYDYGTDELNTIAKNKPIEWFMYITSDWKKLDNSYAILRIGNVHECHLNHFVVENGGGYQIETGGKKYQCLNTNKEMYAKYIYENVLPPKVVIAKIAKLLLK